MASYRSVKVHLARNLLLFFVLAGVTAGLVWWRRDQPAQGINPTISETVTPTRNPMVEASGFNKSQYSVNDPASAWVVVNKGRILPSGYKPSGLVAPNIKLNGSSGSDNMQLREDAASALGKLAAAAVTNSVKLVLVSGFRSYATQQSVYSGYVNSQGQAYADSTSARAGHSEHQTGLAADLGTSSGQCQLEECFANTAEGKWLKSNAYKYGFIIRYEKDKQDLTGYDYEPWHLRFVGEKLAAELKKAGQTLEQFFDLPAYADYPAESYKLDVGR